MNDNEGHSVDALATGLIDDVDVRLLRRVAAEYELNDPVPDGLVEKLRFGITLDALNAEIAQLERMDGLVGARGVSDEVQTITFTSQSLTTMVTISPAGADRVRIDGWIAPGGGVTVELRTATGAFEIRADADGRFVFDDVPRGLAKFVLRAPGGSSETPVVTPSIEL
jgi:hypothetical protein